MGLKVRAWEFEPHPEGWHPLCIKAAEETEGKFGARIKWTLQSKERTEGGTQFEMTLFTSFVASSKSLLGKLVTAAGLELPGNGEEFDTDDLVGRVVEGLIVVEETDKGAFNNVNEVRPRRQKATSKPKPEPAPNDPFADE